MTAVAGAVPLDERQVEPDQWPAEARRLQREGWWFEGLWASEGPPPEIQALWGRPGALALLRMRPVGSMFHSLTSFLPAADWFERAVRDRTGLVPEGHVDPRPFLFHETYPPGHVEGKPLPPRPAAAGAGFPFVRHEGPGLFEIPVGPIHAGIIEPGHFRFTTVGELILDLEVRLNYTHKGTLSLARGQPPHHATRLLERLSGDNAAAHACAFASAWEAATGIQVEAQAQLARTAMVEMERVYNHVGDLAGIAVDVALPAPAAHLQTMREELMRWNQRLFGHRLLMNVIVPGGMLRAPSPTAWNEFRGALAGIRNRFEAATRMMAMHSGLKERVEGTGQLHRATAELLGCVGPTGRASGVPRDARADAPCLAYGDLHVQPVVREQGTVSARMRVKIEEARASLGWLHERLDGSAPSAPHVTAGRDGAGLAMVEASRGAVLSWVRVADGRVADVYQRDPSFLNWRGVEEAVLRNIVPDFPVINKSFGLSYSGSDA